MLRIRDPDSISSPGQVLAHDGPPGEMTGGISCPSMFVYFFGRVQDFSKCLRCIII